MFDKVTNARFVLETKIKKNIIPTTDTITMPVGLKGRGTIYLSFGCGKMNLLHKY